MEVDAPHHRPHFHAVYQDSKAVFALDPIERRLANLAMEPTAQRRHMRAAAHRGRHVKLKPGSPLDPSSPEAHITEAYRNIKACLRADVRRS